MTLSGNFLHSEQKIWVPPSIDDPTPCPLPLFVIFLTPNFDNSFFDKIVPVKYGINKNKLMMEVTHNLFEKSMYS